MSTRNITLSLPDEVVRRAKVLAAQRETSISAMVREMLEQELGMSTNGDLWDREEAEMRSGSMKIGEISWSRDELHRRG